MGADSEGVFLHDPGYPFVGKPEAKPSGEVDEFFDLDEESLAELEEKLREVEERARESRFVSVKDRAKELSSVVVSDMQAKRSCGVLVLTDDAGEGTIFRRNCRADGVIQGGVLLGHDDYGGGQDVSAPDVEWCCCCSDWSDP